MKKITLLFSMLAFSFGFAQNGGDTCATAVAATPGTYTAVAITDTSAGSEMGGVGTYDSAWYSYTPAANGTINISSCDGGADTRLYFGTGTCGTLTTEASNDDSCATGGGATTSYASELMGVPVLAGTTYYIEWDDRWGAIASFDWSLEFLSCTPPVATATSVDDCVNAQFSVDVDLTDLGNATTVTISNDGGVASTTGIAAIGMVTVGPFATGAPVNITLEHDGNSDCNVDLGSYSDSCPPSNDECMGAIAVACDDVVSGNTGLGSDSGVGNAANDLWYSYSGPAGDITASTCTLGYDTAIFVYSDCGTTLVTSNDDSCGTQSSVTFTADGTATYYIVVDGYATSSGAFELTIACAAVIPAPANDECAAAEALVFATPSSGTTAGATENVTEEKPTCDTFGAIADVWYTVAITAGTSDLTLNTTITGTSDQANIAVYSACGGLQADSLSCSDLGGNESVTVAGLANGTYYVRVWSDGTAARNSQRVEGGFDIVADATLSTQDINANGLAFTYYPNPVNDNLALKAQKDIENVSVYNMLGQEVLSTTPNAVNTEVNMSALQSGAYFVKVTIGNATETVRVLKN